MGGVGWAVTLVSLLLLEGCATLIGGQRPLERDGKTYGVTQGAFRGRWWNCYERGSSYLEGGFYAEAVKDFRAALQNRPQDQLWPRTYGLHFLPAYFPNRELGIAYYHQGQIREGTAQLELSLRQRYSARAAFFLNEARRRLLQDTGGDNAPPTVEITAPSGGVPVGTTQVEIAGTARDDSYVAAISVAGHPFDVKVSAPEVPFRDKVTLQPGQNDIEVSVTDLTGKTTVRQVSVDADLDGPIVSFDTPVTFPGTVRGVVSDPSGVSFLRIVGKDAGLVPGPSGAQQFSVDLAREELTPPLRYECADRLGNVTAGVLPLDVMVLSDRLPEVAFAGYSEPVVDLGNGLRALVVNRRVVAVAKAQEPSSGLTVSMDNLQDGQQYFMDEIVVTLNVQAPNPIGYVELNGEKVPMIPARNSLHVSRKVRLSAGANQLVAKASDTQGGSGADQKTVERAPNALEMNKEKLGIAFLGAVLRDGAAPDPDAEYIISELAATKAVQKRFRVVDREEIQQILAEQNLSAALASKSGKLALGKLVPAEIMLSARIRRDQDSIEIVLEGTSTETAMRVLPQVDVAGPAAELDRLIADLGVRLVQELPRVEGQVLQWNSPEITMDLRANQGIRDSLKCIVFNRTPVVNPQTGATLGFKPVIVCEGLINNVSERFSTADALSTEEQPDVAQYPIQPGQFVVIK